MPDWVKNIRQLISKNDLKKVFEVLLQKPILQSLYDEIIILKSNYEENEKNQRIGVLSNQESILELNKIKNSLLKILQQIQNLSKLQEDKPPSNIGFFDPIQLEHLLESKKNSNKFFMLIGISALVFGLVIVIAGFYSEEGLLQGAGIFTSAMSSLSFREFIKRREDIFFLARILDYLTKNKDKKVKEVYLDKLETMYWKKLESAILS